MPNSSPTASDDFLKTFHVFWGDQVFLSLCVAHEMSSEQATNQNNFPATLRSVGRVQQLVKCIKYALKATNPIWSNSMKFSFGDGGIDRFIFFFSTEIQHSNCGRAVSDLLIVRIAPQLHPIHLFAFFQCILIDYWVDFPQKVSILISWWSSQGFSYSFFCVESEYHH